MRGTALGDDRLHASGPQRPAVLDEVIATIGEEAVGPQPWPAGLATHWTEWQQLGDVVAVVRGQGDGQPDELRQSRLGGLRQ
jgi:hypothetical protein